MEKQQSSQSTPLKSVENSSQTGPRGQKTLVAKAKQKFSPGIKFGLLVAVAIYLTLIVVGGYGVNKCPLEHNIPLFLIATAFGPGITVHSILGGIGLITKSISYIRDYMLPHLNVKYIETSLYSVEVAFFILGSFWVYKEYPPKYEPQNGEPYCNKLVYMLAFIYLTVVGTVIMSIFAGFMFFLVCICFLTSVEESTTTVDAEAQTNIIASENDEPTAV